MNKKKLTWISLVLALILALSMTIMGCEPKQPDPSDSSQPAVSDKTEPAPPESKATEPEEPKERVFTDSVGREVTIPTKLMRIAPSGPLAQMVLYTAAPDLLCGTARPFSDTQLKLINKKYGDLPAFGQFYGKSGDFNLEAVLAAVAE
jgi:iron complex transport system substrate-binding protein